jgi:hypothetical protein
MLQFRPFSYKPAGTVFLVLPGILKLFHNAGGNTVQVSKHTFLPPDSLLSAKGTACDPDRKNPLGRSPTSPALSVAFAGKKDFRARTGEF